MKYSKSNSLAVVCGPLLLLSTIFAQFGSGQEVFLDIQQQPNAAGILEYEVSVVAVLFDTTTFFDVTAPDGTVFDSSTAVGSLDFQQLESRFFGEWTVGTDESFTLNPFGINDVFSEVPEIISPASTVSGSSFLLEWEYPSGPISSTKNTIIASPFPSSIDRVSSTSFNVILDSPSGIISATDIVFSVGNGNDFNEFISVEASSSLSFDTDFTTLSQEFTVRVVPEPGTGGILPLAMLIFAGLRRRAEF